MRKLTQSLIYAFLLALALSAAAPSARASSDLADPDLSTMIALQTTYGWGPVFGWAPNTNPCPANGQNWNGVVCIRGHVQSIIADCGATQLNAPIPPILFQLTELTTLEARNCGFTGSIPDSIANAINLSSLRFDNNVLTGTIPAALATLPQLSNVELDNNLLTGAIPCCFSNLDFVIVSLAGNLLTGIPAGWTGFDRDISNNCFVSLPASCSESVTYNNICTPNRQDCPGSVTIANVSGDGQRTQVNTAFANPLVVSVTDLFNNPVSGATVTFSGPGIVTTVANTGISGQASANIQANSTVGGNTVTASMGPPVMTTFGLTAGLASTCSPSIVVTNNGASGPGTLMEALADVCPGGTVNLSGIAGQTIALAPGASSYNFSGRLYIATDVTILGNGVTISGSGATRIFFVQNGNVTLQNLILTNGLGQGGTSQFGGSAGGLGGAIFENNGNLTLNQVSLNGNQAVGGSPDQSGNGQGGGFGANSAGGDLGGTAGIGDGAGGFLQGVGGIGGFGAGGGEGTYQPVAASIYGGDGGFAGGGGIGVQRTFVNSGNPGWGAGLGSASIEGGNPGGGSGAGFGGAIFVRAGTLSLSGVNFTDNQAVGGTGAQGKGGALFLYNGANLNLVPNSVTYTGSVAAAAGAPGQGYSANPYNGNATCPGTDTVDVCGVLPTNFLSVTASGSGAVTDTTGLINCPSACSAMFTSGTTLTATPAAGNYFSGWSGGCSGTGACTVSVASGSVAATANFQPTTNPIITWSNPAPMVFGGALSSLQLNATANVAGTFVYTPPAGTVLPVGNNQILSVTFTPSDTVHYNTASAQVQINVVAAGGTAANLVVTSVLTRNSGTNQVVATITVANTGGTAAANAQLTSAAMGSTAGITALPISLGTIAAGGSAQAVVTFPASVGTTGTRVVLSLAGTYTGGTFSSSARVTLP